MNSIAKSPLDLPITAMSHHEFHMYREAGHGYFYYYPPMYLQTQAVHGWQKVFVFLEDHLGSSA